MHLCSCRQVLNRLLIWSRKKDFDNLQERAIEFQQRDHRRLPRTSKETLTKRPTTRMMTYLLQKLPWRLPGIVGHSVEKEIVPLVHLSKQCDVIRTLMLTMVIMVVVIKLRITHLELVQLLLHRLHLHHHLAHQLLAT